MKRIGLPGNETLRTGRGWLILFLLPPICLLGVFVTWAGFEYREWLTVRTKIQAREAARQVVTREQLAQACFDRANIDGIFQWTSLVRQSQTLHHPLFAERLIAPNDLLATYSPYMNFNDSAHTTWLLQSSADGNEFIPSMKPIFDRLDKVSTQPRPIWVPNTGETDRSRSTFELNLLLNLEIVDSILKQDRSRILLGLERLQQFERLTVGSEIGGSCSTAIWQSQNRYWFLSLCLQVPGWSADELTQLESFARTETELSKRWDSDVDAWTINSLDSTDTAHTMYFINRSSNLIDQVFRPTPSRKADMLRGYEQLKNISFDEPFQAAREINRVSFANRTIPQRIMLMNLRDSLIECELRRLTVRCGIAIRRYKQIHGKWPKELNELNQNPATMIDIALPMGYSINYTFSKLAPELRTYRTNSTVDTGMPEGLLDMLTQKILVLIRDTTDGDHTDSPIESR